MNTQYIPNDPAHTPNLSDCTPTILELLDAAAARQGEAPFIRYVKNGETREKSFARVREDSLAFCRLLRSRCGTGEHIALIGKSSYEYIVCLTGILLSGNVAVPAAPDIPEEEAVRLLEHADVTFVLYGAEFADRIEPVRSRCPRIGQVCCLGNEREMDELFRRYGSGTGCASLPEPTPDPRACALLIYTSGSTGDRKGVMLSSRALVENMRFVPRSDYVVHGGVLLSVLPMYHIFCFVSDYLGSLLHGNTLCLNGEMRELFTNMRRFRPDTIRIVPMLAQAILARIHAVEAQHPELSPEQAAAQVTGGNLKWLVSGGAYLDASVCRAFEKYGIYLRQGYGMSEAGCKIAVPDEDAAVDCVGRAMSNLKVRVRDGEIQVDTPCRMLGYYKDPEATEAMFTPDGWLKTGDLGTVSEEGEIFITGRVKNLIILSNGENVSPESLEKKLKEHLLVSECLVYAEQDRIAADIFPDRAYAGLHGITDIAAALEEIADGINRNALPSHTIAKIVVKDEPLPKGATGKILRKERKDGEYR